VDLRRRTAVVAIDLAHERDVDILALGERLSVVERLELGKLLAVLLDQVGEREQATPARGGGHRAPGAFERCASSPDRAVDVLGTGLVDFADRLAGGRIDRREGLP